ncbi:MAG: TonB-dependent receptor [Nitrospiraceae bacterium]|nr:TonB-dependent receptor [Nitrospiraceae bacterium]
MPSARAKSVIKSTPSLSRFVKNGKIDVKSWQEALGRLKPETGYGLEVGTKYHREGLNLNLKGFYTYINDYVGKYPTNHAPTYNIDNVKLYGAVLEGRKSLMRNVSFRGLLTYENTRKSGDRLLVDSKRLPNIPKWKFDGYLRVEPYDNLFVTPSVHYVGKRPTGGAPLQTIDTLGGYTTYDVALNYSYKTLRFDFLAQNIFDRKAYERIDSPVLERCFTFRMAKEF